MRRLNLLISQRQRNTVLQLYFLSISRLLEFPKTYDFSSLVCVTIVHLLLLLFVRLWFWLFSLLREIWGIPRAVVFVGRNPDTSPQCYSQHHQGISILGNISYIIIITMNPIFIIIITMIAIINSSYLENREGENLVWQHIRNSTWTWHQLRSSFDRHLGLQHPNTHHKRHK